jgi:hypothetical protein
MTTEKSKDLDYWKSNAEEDYITTPISVLRYIDELEQQVKSVDLSDVVGRSEQLPQPDCHFYDEEYDKWIWAYSKELIDSLR